MSDYIQHWDRTGFLLTEADGVRDSATLSLYVGYLIACVPANNYEERKVMVMQIVQYIEARVMEEINEPT